jgi:Flp pilus assembly protein TadB
MSSPGHRISRPLYEALPYIYIVCGLAALTASYVHPSKLMSLLLGLPGLLAVLGGVVVALRRRDYRQMKANNYLSNDSSPLSKRDE